MEAWAERVLYGLVLLLAASLPFEPIRPLWTAGWIDINHLKLLLALTLVVWLVAGRKRWRELRGVWPAALFLAVAGLSAAFASADRGEALKFVGRLGSGLYGLALVRHVATTRQRLGGLAWALVLGAGTSAVLGIGEAVVFSGSGSGSDANAASASALHSVLATFKVAPTHVGADLRVSASFQYATIAAMFFELAVPLALVLAATAGSRAARGLATAIGVVCSVVVVLTLTRAGVAALGIALGGLLALAWARHRARHRWGARAGSQGVLGQRGFPSSRQTTRWGLALGAVVRPTVLAGASMAVVLVGLATQVRAFDARVDTENDWGWYAATYAAPATLALTLDAPAQAVVVARNTGQVTWTSDGSHRFALAYRWLSADATAQLELPSTMLDLPHDVAPGESIQMTVPVQAPLPPGDYRLAWGMLQQNVLWFHDRGFPDAETAVHISSGTAAHVYPGVAQEPRSDLSAGLAPVPRLALWQAAVRMVVQHPLLGVGPDNFRHVYGRYLGLPAWDERVHANNLYLELGADLGVLGAAAFGLVLAPVLIRLVRALSTSVVEDRTIWLAGLGASLVTFFVHGALDYFLGFTPVYLLFWFVVGMTDRLTSLERC